MCSIPNTEQTGGSSRQRLGLAGVGLQENATSKCRVGTEPCVGKVEGAFSAAGTSHSHLCCTSAFIVLIPLLCFTGHYKSRDGIALGFCTKGSLVSIVFVTCMIVRVRFVKRAVQSLLRSQCMKLEGAAWRVLVLGSPPGA